MLCLHWVSCLSNTLESFSITPALFLGRSHTSPPPWIPRAPVHTSTIAPVACRVLLVHESTSPAGPGTPVRTFSCWQLYSQCEHGAWHRVSPGLMLSSHPDSQGWCFRQPADKTTERKAHQKTSRDFPGGPVGWEAACRRRGPGFNL